MWTYIQQTGELIDPSATIIAKGYAGGNCGKDPVGVNNPDMAHVKCVGPLPTGIYTFGEPVLQSHLGPFAIPLIPDPANNMHGRSGFFMHGDTNPSGKASEGCVIMPRAIRELVAHSTAHQLRVVRDREDI